MYKATTFFFALALSIAGTVYAQSTEYALNPERTGELTDPFPVGEQNGARGLSGPWDLDRDGQLEVLVAQHDAAGGRVFVIENTGVDTWELVYATAFIDSSSSSTNARYATGADLDGDGNWEIVFVAGNGYSDANPAFAQGVYVFEHDGVVGSDNYGTFPATIGNFYELDGFDPPSSVYAQKLQARDVDGDGLQELLVPANGPSSHDILYVLSVSGTFEPNSAGTGFEAWQIEARVGPREEGNAFGGGSPSDIIAADLDGNGNIDISFHSWNNFVLFNGTATAADTYALPDIAAENRFINGFRPGEDDVALFGGTAGDIDGDGNDEVFYPNWFTKNIGVLDYDPGDDVLQITEDKFAFDAIPLGGAGGIALGDTDGDGAMELIVGASGYSASNFNNGEPSQFIHIAEYNGGDPKDGNNYSITVIDTGSPIDSTGFNTVYRDSAGVVTKYYESALSKQGVISDSEGNDPVFPSGLAFLGDADGDGSTEIALSFQGVDDSLRVYDELWNPDSLTGVFNTPVGANDPGPIDSGGAYEFEIDAAPGSRLSLATMFVPSNDLFFAPADSGIALWNTDGSQRSGDVTAEFLLWDAGTEENQEPGNGDNQAPAQGAPNTGPADPDPNVRLVDDGFVYPAVADVIQVTLTPGASGTQFTIRVENVSTGTTLGGASSVPLAPGVSVIHTLSGPLFTDGEPDRGEGLEALAEDGNPATLGASLAAALGYHRTLREQFEAPVRPFLRIISMDGLAVSTDDDIVVPSDYVLSPNYPNPFNPSTSFTFTLPIDKRVSVRIYDVTGRLVKTLVKDELYSAGKHQATWDGTNQANLQVASGMYLYTLEYGNFRQSHTMLLIK